MTSIQIDGVEYNSITEAQRELDQRARKLRIENAERLPSFSLAVVQYLYCSWCNQTVADNVLDSDRQQTEYEHIRTVHPLAEKFFFYVP